MKFRLGLVLLLVMILSACASAPAAPPPTQTPAPTATSSAAPVAASASGKGCGQGACVRQAFVQNDGERLIFMFDLVGPGNTMNQDNPPQFLGNLVVGSYYLKADGSEDFLVGGELAPGKYYCYDGTDLPWTVGDYGAVCGFSVPLADMQTYKPQVGEKVRVNLPFYSNFDQTVTVMQGQAEAQSPAPTQTAQ